MISDYFLLHRNSPHITADGYNGRQWRTGWPDADGRPVGLCVAAGAVASARRFGTRRDERGARPFL